MGSAGDADSLADFNVSSDFALTNTIGLSMATIMAGLGGLPAAAGTPASARPLRHGDEGVADRSSGSGGDGAGSSGTEGAQLSARGGQQERGPHRGLQGNTIGLSMNTILADLAGIDGISGVDLAVLEEALRAAGVPCAAEPTRAPADVAGDSAAAAAAASARAAAGSDRAGGSVSTDPSTVPAPAADGTASAGSTQRDLFISAPTLVLGRPSSAQHAGAHTAAAGTSTAAIRVTTVDGSAVGAAGAPAFDGELTDATTGLGPAFERGSLAGVASEPSLSDPMAIDHSASLLDVGDLGHGVGSVLDGARGSSGSAAGYAGEFADGDSFVEGYGDGDAAARASAASSPLHAPAPVLTSDAEVVRLEVDVADMRDELVRALALTDNDVSREEAEAREEVGYLEDVLDDEEEEEGEEGEGGEGDGEDSEGAEGDEDGQGSAGCEDDHDAEPHAVLHCGGGPSVSAEGKDGGSSDGADHDSKHGDPPAATSAAAGLRAVQAATGSRPRAQRPAAASRAGGRRRRVLRRDPYADLIPSMDTIVAGMHAQLAGGGAAAAAGGAGSWGDHLDHLSPEAAAGACGLGAFAAAAMYGGAGGALAAGEDDGYDEEDAHAAAARDEL